MEDIEVKKHREMIVVVSALVDEKDETQIHIETKVFANEPYYYLADSIAATMIGIGKTIRKNVKKEEEAKNNETDKVEVLGNVFGRENL